MAAFAHQKPQEEPAHPMHRTRVLHVINRLSGSGAETSLRELLAQTDPAFAHGLVVLSPDRNNFEGIAESVDLFVPRVTPRGLVRRVAHVRSAIRAFRPDLVHTSLYEANLAGRIAARSSQVPVLVSLVNTPYVPEAALDRVTPHWKRRVVRAVDTFLGRHATTAFHAITEAVASAAVRDQRLQQSRIHVIPRARNPERLGSPSPERRERTRRQLGIDPSTPVLLAVGREEAQKGHRYLVAALPLIQEQYPDVLLLIAGRRGSSSGPIDEAVDGLGLNQSVVRLGHRSDVGDLLSAADVFVFPSLYEGLGGAVLEAMAMEVPIVASDVPALREVLDDGRCGLLVPIAEPAELARAVCAVLPASQAARQRICAARDRLNTVYSPERVHCKMLSLFRLIAAEA